MLNHNYIGTEHILLGLRHEGHGVAARVLEDHGLTLDTLRREVERIIETDIPIGQIPFTQRSKKVMELSLREAMQLGHQYIGTEHILLALLREGQGVAVQILRQQDDQFDRLRTDTIQLLRGHATQHGIAESTSITISGVHREEAAGEPFPGPKCPRCSANLVESISHATIQSLEAEDTRTFVAVFCSACGSTIGVLPG